MREHAGNAYVNTTTPTTSTITIPTGAHEIHSIRRRAAISIRPTRPCAAAHQMQIPKHTIPTGRSTIVADRNTDDTRNPNPVATCSLGAYRLATSSSSVNRFPHSGHRAPESPRSAYPHRGHRAFTRRM